MFAVAMIMGDDVGLDVGSDAMVGLCGGCMVMGRNSSWSMTIFVTFDDDDTALRLVLAMAADRGAAAPGGVDDDDAEGGVDAGVWPLCVFQGGSGAAAATEHDGVAEDEMLGGRSRKNPSILVMGGSVGRSSARR